METVEIFHPYIAYNFIFCVCVSVCADRMLTYRAFVVVFSHKKLPPLFPQTKWPTQLTPKLFFLLTLYRKNPNAKQMLANQTTEPKPKPKLHKPNNKRTLNTTTTTITQSGSCAAHLHRHRRSNRCLRTASRAARRSQLLRRWYRCAAAFAERCRNAWQSIVAFASAQRSDTFAHIFNTARRAGQQRTHLIDPRICARFKS